MRILLLFLLSSLVFAEVSKEVLLQGKVGGSFSDKEVTIIDSYGQSMVIPRKAFPKNFKMETGAPFSFEVDPKLIHSFKAAKKSRP